MAEFRVWAPKASQMEVQAGSRLLLMECGESGWWRAEVHEAGPGTDYGFVIDGEGPYPDPRSRWQPNGVHKLSRLMDHGAFVWTDEIFQARPLASALIYELHIGAFTPQGTFLSAIEKLDYLRQLGITHIELMPVNSFPGERGWGYDGVDLFAPQESYGGPEGLKRLVDAAHARGLAVILDVVYNHLGPAGNYLDKFGPYHSDRHRTGWGEAMNFSGPGSDTVRDFFIENAVMWLRDYHIDGLRLDAVHAFIDDSAVHFLERLAMEVTRLEAQLGRHLVLIAESELNDPRIVRPPEQGGYGIDAQWSDDFHHALHVLLTGEQAGYYKDFDDWDDLYKALVSVFVYDRKYSPLRNRMHGRSVGQLPGHRFLGYIQNHDQVGNRAGGERIAHLVGPDLAKVAAAVVLTSPFVPMLFMGEEWAASAPFQYFTDHEEELGRRVSEGRRGEFAGFGWRPEDVPDPQDEQTFLRSKLNWEERSQEPHASVLDWYRRLIALRRGVSPLVDGRLGPTDVLYDAAARWLVVLRGPVRLVCNFSDEEQMVYLDTQGAELMLASDPGARVADDGALMPPRAAMFFRKEG